MEITLGKVVPYLIIVENDVKVDLNIRYHNINDVF